jgi:hypothetical protein
MQSRDGKRIGGKIRERYRKERPGGYEEKMRRDGKRIEKRDNEKNKG